MSDPKDHKFDTSTYVKITPINTERNPSALQQAQREITKLKAELEKKNAIINTAKHDYWFMTNLLEKYSTNKEEAIKDCIERMKFRKPMFNEVKDV